MLYQLNDVTAWKLPIDMFCHDVIIVVAKYPDEFRKIFDELYIDLHDEVKLENFTFAARTLSKKGEPIYLLLNSGKIENIHKIIAHESIHVFNQLMDLCGIETKNDEELMAYFCGWFCGEVITGLPKNLIEKMTWRWDDKN